MSTTETELKLRGAVAIMGLSRRPEKYPGHQVLELLSLYDGVLIRINGETDLIARLDRLQE